MRDYIPSLESAFFHSLEDFFDSEKDAAKQHQIANYDLSRMFPLAQLAGSPEKRLKIVHIAGTKGKGSTSHFISALLSASGCSTGLNTSPHLSTVRERFQLDNHLISYQELQSQCDTFAAMVRNASLTPSLFELFTLLALRIFVSNRKEYAVMETGIGGRLDATNYISSPQITVITPISYDHQALLGHTVQQIASEKAGILKPGVPVVISRQPYPEAEEVILERAHTQGCPVIRPVSCSECLPFLPPHLPDFLQENFTTALAAVRHLGYNPAPKQFVYPQLRARCECICASPLIVLDGAHNGDSMEKLTAALPKLYPGTNWHVILGCVQGKNIHAIVQALTHLEGARFILTHPHTGKGSALEELQTEARQAGLAIEAVIPQLTAKEQLPAAAPLLFTGSFFTALIGEEIFNS